MSEVNQIEAVDGVRSYSWTFGSVRRSPADCRKTQLAQLPDSWPARILVEYLVAILESGCDKAGVEVDVAEIRGLDSVEVDAAKPAWRSIRPKFGGRCGRNSRLGFVEIRRAMELNWGLPANGANGGPRIF